MAKQLQLRRGTSDEIAAFTGAVGEPSYDTQTKSMQVHDGATAGGFDVSRIRIVEEDPGLTQYGNELLHINALTGAMYYWHNAWITLIAGA